MFQLCFHTDRQLCFWGQGKFLNFLLSAFFSSRSWWICFAPAPQFCFIHKYWSGNGLTQIMLCMPSMSTFLFSATYWFKSSYHFCNVPQSHFQKLLLYIVAFSHQHIQQIWFWAPKQTKHNFLRLLPALNNAKNTVPLYSLYTYIWSSWEFIIVSQWSHSERLSLHNFAEKTEQIGRLNALLTLWQTTK